MLGLTRGRCGGRKITKRKKGGSEEIRKKKRNEGQQQREGKGILTERIKGK